MTLPPDIEDVWGCGRMDGNGRPAHHTAEALIDTWGLEAFRASAIHQAAVSEIARDRRRAAGLRRSDLKKVADKPRGKR